MKCCLFYPVFLGMQIFLKREKKCFFLDCLMKDWKAGHSFEKILATHPILRDMISLLSKKKYPTHLQ